MTKFFICTALLFAVIIMSAKGQKAGGLGESRPVDDDVTALIDRLRSKIIEQICASSEKCPSSDAKIVITSYKTQVVAGTNYFVGLNIDDVHYHARIFSQPWTQTEELHGIQTKQPTEELEYFV